MKPRLFTPAFNLHGVFEVPEKNRPDFNFQLQQLAGMADWAELPLCDKSLQSFLKLGADVAQYFLLGKPASD
jgi:hypothetical protein